MVLDHKINLLYNNLSYYDTNILEYDEKRYFPNNILNPRLSIISTGVKQYKKHIFSTFVSNTKSDYL